MGGELAQDGRMPADLDYLVHRRPADGAGRHGTRAVRAAGLTAVARVGRVEEPLGGCAPCRAVAREARLTQGAGALPCGRGQPVR